MKYSETKSVAEDYVSRFQVSWCFLFLMMISPKSGRKLWGFPRFSGDYASKESDITDYCSQMFLQLHEVYDPKKVSTLLHVDFFMETSMVCANAYFRSM